MNDGKEGLCISTSFIKNLKYLGRYTKSQVFITSEEAEQGVNPMDINKGMRSYRFPFHPFVQTKDGD